MKDYQTIFFDLDGTLTDSGPGVFNAVLYALEHYGIAVEERESLRRFVGPPLVESFQRFYSFSKEQSLEAVDLYRAYYTRTGIFENSVYPGIETLLRDLKTAGKTLAVATSKPEGMARQVLDYFSLTPYFDHIVGATLDGSLVRKADIVRLALAHFGLSGGEALLVGDRYNDVEGALANGMACLGALWGYGSREELLSAGAAAVAETPEEAGRLILGR